MLRRFGWKIVLAVIVLSMAMAFVLPQHPLPGCLKETGIQFVWNQKDETYQYPYKDWDKVQSALRRGGFETVGGVDSSDPKGGGLLGANIWEKGSVQIIEGETSHDKDFCFIQVPNVFEQLRP